MKIPLINSDAGATNEGADDSVICTGSYEHPALTHAVSITEPALERYKR